MQPRRISTCSSWRTYIVGNKTAKAVSLYTCEAEYLATRHALYETLWIHLLTQDIPTLWSEAPITFNIDNQFAVMVVKNSSPTRRRKHIQIHHHHIQHYQHTQNIAALHFLTHQNKADILTNPLLLALHHAALLQNHIVNKLSRLSDFSLRFDKCLCLGLIISFNIYSTSPSFPWLACPSNITDLYYYQQRKIYSIFHNPQILEVFSFEISFSY